MESRIHREVYVRFGGGVFLQNALVYGFLTVAGGIIITFAKEILNIIVGG